MINGINSTNISYGVSRQTQLQLPKSEEQSESIQEKNRELNMQANNNTNNINKGNIDIMA